jgi:hypothetical protein
MEVDNAVGRSDDVEFADEHTVTPEDGRTRALLPAHIFCIYNWD